jgi:hypothetical protein
MRRFHWPLRGAAAKEELLEQLWPGRFVSEALTSRMMAMRRKDCWLTSAARTHCRSV